MSRWSLMVAMVAMVACSKSTPAADDAAAATPTPTPTPTASTEAGAAAAEGGAAPAAKGAAASYAGKYTVTAGAMYVPAEKDWAAVKFKNEETKHLGDGEMTLAIDPSGRVSGTTEGGPLGASVIEGMSEGGVVTATIRRKDPADEGLTGTLSGTLAGDTVTATMKLAEFNAAIVREAKLEAKKK